MSFGEHLAREQEEKTCFVISWLVSREKISFREPPHESREKIEF